MTKPRVLLLLVLGFVTLGGCTTTRYVRTPCLSQEQLEQQRQAEPPKIHDKLTGRADQDIRTIAGNNIRLRAWGEGLMTILGGCTG